LNFGERSFPPKGSGVGDPAYASTQERHEGAPPESLCHRVTLSTALPF
jgi:hypothetical protein